MRLNSLRIAVISLLSVLLLMAVSAVAVAEPLWSDAPPSWWVSSYGVTEAEVATVADGYPDGTFLPRQAVTRGQFAKMAVNGLGVDTADPLTPTFKDVPKGSTFYTHIEGAYDAELIGGYVTSSGLYYRPGNTITRQQANSILGRYLSDLEIKYTGRIKGDVTDYGSLELWYNAEGKNFYLIGKFDDAGSVLPDHRATTAYLSYRDIVRGSNAKLNPNSTLIRSQAAALVLRVKAEAAAILTPPPAPVNLEVAATGTGKTVVQTGGDSFAGNDPTPQVRGDTLSSRPIAVYDDGVKLLEDSSTASGKFYADITTALVDGAHSFTAKVMNVNGLVSPASAPVAYLLDTVLPTGSITAPAPAAGEEQAVVTSPKPAFTVTATDAATGIKSVQFQVAVEAASPVWQTVSTDYSPDQGTTTYAAVWPLFGPLTGGLDDGDYQFRAVVTDVAGNESTLGPLGVEVITMMPVVSITHPEPNGGTVFPGWFVTESPNPVFTATVSESGASIEKVDFFYAPWVDPGSSPVLPGPDSWEGFTLLATVFSEPYVAAYSGLPEGRYIFAVRVTDAVGNESELMDGAAYKTGVTQEVFIDRTAPTINITAPTAGQLVPDATDFTIAWTVADASPSPTVLIEYSFTGDEPWTTITTAAPFTPGSYVWTVPDINGEDVTTCRIRITAADEAGALVDDIAGHTAVEVSEAFTVYDGPVSAAGVTGEDPDSSEAGVDWRDFRAEWTLPTPGHIVLQRVFLLQDDLTLDLDSSGSVDVPVASYDDNSTEWASTDSLVTDTRGDPLAAGTYKIWVVVTDSAGRTATASSEPFDVVAP